MINNLEVDALIRKWLYSVQVAYPTFYLENEIAQVGRLIATLCNSMQEPFLNSTQILLLKQNIASQNLGGIDVPVSIGGQGKHPINQIAFQFIAGYHELNLRDVAHAGHGRLILENGSPDQISKWSGPLLREGALAGIALTEAVGGSNIFNHSTTVSKVAENQWLLNGEKAFISRVLESSVFIVFARPVPSSNNRALSAVILDADRLKLSERTLIESDGLRSFSWGRMKFKDIPITSADFLGDPDAGRDIFEKHFVRYRVMASAAVLGAAAKVLDIVQAKLMRRRTEGSIERYRDSAMETLGRIWIELTSLISMVFSMPETIKAQSSDLAMATSRALKAHVVSTAYRSVTELAELAGASSFEANDPIAKTIRDLRAFIFAGGVESELFRSAGRALLEGNL